MTHELKALLVAVHNYLEWKEDPRAFVREPLFNLADSYKSLLESGELPWPDARNDFELHFGERYRELEKLYMKTTEENS